MISGQMMGALRETAWEKGEGCISWWKIPKKLKFILLVEVTLRALTNPKFRKKVYFLFPVRRQLCRTQAPLTWLCCALGHEVPASICQQENRESGGPNTHPLLKSLCLEMKSLLITFLWWDLVTWPHLYAREPQKCSPGLDCHLPATTGHYGVLTCDTNPSHHHEDSHVALPPCHLIPT